MTIWKIIKLYLPILLCIGFGVLFFIFRYQDEKLYTIIFEKFGLKIEFPISSYSLKKGILLIASITSLLSYIFYDFSNFFPTELEMDVFWDEEGINKMLALFTKEEIADFHVIADNMATYQADYYNLMNLEAKKLLKAEIFDINRKEFHSEGKITFVVQKIRGIHNYHIKESRGELKHVLDKPKTSLKEYRTIFDKINSPSDIINPTFKDIFFKNRVIIKPRCKQILSENQHSPKKVFNHILCGYTVINLFPYPKFSDTLYFLEHENKYLVPVGYAVYRAK